MSTRSLLMLIAWVRFGSTTKGESADLCATKAKTPKYIAIRGSHRVLLTVLTFRHCASCILGQAFHCSPENAFYIFNQQIYFVI